MVDGKQGSVGLRATRISTLEHSVCYCDDHHSSNDGTYLVSVCLCVCVKFK